MSHRRYDRRKKKRKREKKKKNKDKQKREKKEKRGKTKVQQKKLQKDKFSLFFFLIFFIHLFLLKGVSIIGDRMDTDVLAGLESMLEPILVLSGVTTKESILNYSYRPFLVVNDVGDIPEHEIFLNEKKIEKL